MLRNTTICNVSVDFLMMLLSVDNYIQRCPQHIQVLLRAMRKTILSAIPGGVEKISYGIPTVDLFGKHVVHFAAFKNHISFFPTPSPIPVFQKALARYKTSKGAIQFPLDKPIPYDLIRRITEFRVREVTSIKR